MYPAPAAPAGPTTRLPVRMRCSACPGIGPLVVYGTGAIQRPWSHQGDELVLIDGKGVLPAVVRRKAIVEPVATAGIEDLHRFPEGPSAQGGPARTAVVRNDQVA